MNKQREFWKHNINPITGFVYSKEYEKVKINDFQESYLKKWGFSRREESFDAEYIFFE